MPFFDFECKKCGKVKTEMMNWSKTMHKKVPKCECGAKNFKHIITVSWQYTRDLSGKKVSKEEREAEKLIRK